MKKIILIFFTFSGIYKGFAQKPAGSFSQDSVKQTGVIIDQIKQTDSVIEKEKPAIRLYPNPAKNKVEVEIKGFKPGFVQVQIFDKTGNLMRDAKRLVLNGNEIIVLMFSLPPGLYFIRLRQEEINIRARLIVQ